MHDDEQPGPLESARARLAHEIRRRRTTAGLSQPQLASRVGYTRQYVSLAERPGRNVPSTELVKAIDRALEADGVLVSLHAQCKSEQRALREQSLVTTITSTAQAVQPGDVGELMMSAAEESSRFLAWAESTNVGDLAVEQMRAEVQRIAYAYLTVPTLPLFARTKALRDRTFTLLAGHQEPRHTRELYAVAGWSLTLLSWISVDLGRLDAAEDHARVAWRCAESADHNALRAWVRATQHTASFWQGDYTAAAGYAADGLTYTGTGSAELFLASALALDLARAGDAATAEKALRRAWQVADAPEQSGEDLAGPLTCSMDRAGSLWSDTELALGRAENALTASDRAVAQFAAAPQGKRNHGSERMARLQQVKAHLVLGEPHAAEQALGPVLDTPVDSRVRPLLRRVSEVGVLADRSADPVARRIRNAVAEFHKHTATKELTT